ncbi:MAG: hypothetical protein ACK5MT_04370 [Actinomycetales bacterium]
MNKRGLAALVTAVGIAWMGGPATAAGQSVGSSSAGESTVRSQPVQSQTAQPPASAAAPATGALLPGAAHGEAAIRALGENLDEAAARNDRTPAELTELLSSDPTFWLDSGGRLLVKDELSQPAAELTDPATATLANPQPVFPDSQTFSLHSKPGSNRVIYLNFVGGSLDGTAWTDLAENGPAPTGPLIGFDLDGNPGSFTSAEHAVIQEAFLNVAEDYAPFDVDVTTEPPGQDALVRSSQSDLTYGTTAFVTQTPGVASAVCNNQCSGIAYVGSFDFIGSDYYEPALVFPQFTAQDGNALALVISHEVGHNLNLEHDGYTTSEYYGGRSNWGPIMGNPRKPLTQWSNGDYVGATQTQDDVAEIAAMGVVVRPDDVPGTRALDTATSFPGLIERSTDVDRFSFSPACTTTGAISATVDDTATNLDIKLSLYDSGNVLIEENDPPSGMTDNVTATGVSASITRTLNAGTYYVEVQGVGRGTLSDGYSDYGSLGQYTLSVPACPLIAGTVSITGPTTMGGTLTAATADWSPLPVTFSYQWLRNGSAIAGATGSSYVTVPADVGAGISVRVTATRSGYAPTTVTSSVTSAITPATMSPGTVTVSGSAVVGGSLSADPGSWTPAEATLSYQWLRDGSPISGAVGNTYAPVAADLGTTVSVRVTGTAPGYLDGSATSSGVVVAQGTLTPSASVSGSTGVGSTLSADTGTWGPAPVTFAYQWLRGGSAISGATQATYTTNSADLGAMLSVRVTGSKSGYTTATVTSAPFGPMLAAVSPGTPTVSGSAKPGNVLVANPGTWGPAPVTLAYQWLRDGSALPGATGSSYQLVTADAGHQVSVRVTGTKSGYASASATSSAVGVNPVGAMLVGGEQLAGDAMMMSPSGQFRITGDAGFVERDANNRVLFTRGVGQTRLVMQTDGNLVLYDASGALWWSGTWGNPGAFVILQDDANLVLYRANGTPLWFNGAVDDRLEPIPTISQTARMTGGQQLTSLDRRVRLVMQSDGNFVAYAPRGAIWSSRTWGNPGAWLQMQNDGNLVLYSSSGQALWATNTPVQVGGSAKMVVQNDGNVVVYGSRGAVWATYAFA